MSERKQSGKQHARVRRTRVILGVLALLSVVGASLWRPYAASHRAADDTADAQQSSWAARLFGGEGGERFRTGEVIVYALQHETAVDVAEGGGRLYQLNASGDWTVRVLEVQRERVLLAATLEHAKLISATGRSVPASEYRAAEQELAVPVFIGLDKRGRVEELRFDPRTPRAVSDVLRSIVALSQAVAPDSAKKERWLPTESDSSGKYLAEYLRKSASHWTKRKLKYTEVPSSTLSSPATLEVTASHADLVLDGRGALEQLELRETVSSSLQVLPALISNSALKLTRKSATQDLPAVAALRDRAAKLQGLALYEAPTTADDELQIERSKVAGRNLGDFVSAFEALPENTAQSSEESARARRNFVELGALLRIDDNAVDQAMAAILSDSPIASTLWDALASAGTPKAQAMLRQLIDDPRFDAPDRRTQLIGLSFVAKPTEETVRFLADHVDDPAHAQQARFGLGTALNHLRATDDARARDGSALLQSKLEAATTAQDISDYLRALGNAGHPTSKSTIEHYLTSQEGQVRSSAVTALRFMPGDDVGDTLLQLVKSDPDPSVRADAIDTLRYRAPTEAALDAVFDAQQDEYQRIRDNAQSTLADWRRDYPPIDDALAAFERTPAP